MKTIQQLAQEALDVQNASNLSGVVKGWARSIQDLIDRLRESGQYEGTDQINRHPINRMWASKVHDLTGMSFCDTMEYVRTMEACEQLAKQPDEPAKPDIREFVRGALEA